VFHTPPTAPRPADSLRGRGRLLQTKLTAPSRSRDATPKRPRAPSGDSPGTSTDTKRQNKTPRGDGKSKKTGNQERDQAVK
jgi:hypothetical protein